MFIDTHGHVNFNAFKEDSDLVLKRALENDTWVIMPGTQYSTSKRSIEMAEKYEQGVYSAIGLHPIHLEEREVDSLETQSETLRQAQGEKSWMIFQTRGEEFDYEKYKELAYSKKVVAIGEVGLDYYYEPKGKEKRDSFRLKQKTTLALQVKLAQEHELPVIFHCRKAHNELIEFLGKKQVRGTVHCYTGTLAQAKTFYDMGMYFGFNGLIFKKVAALPDPTGVISNIPLERILLETDSPYLAPAEALAKEGFKTERNEPLYVQYVAQEIARIKGISLKEVKEVTAQNAKTLFGL